LTRDASQDQDAPVGSYLVTGCAGFLGSHLVEAILGRGHIVVGVDSFSDYYPRETKESNLAVARDHPDFRLIQADLATDDLRHLVDDTNGVFHLAAQPGVRGSWGETFALYARDNLVATQRIFEAAAGAGRRTVWASSSSIYGDAETYPTPEDTDPRPISPYGVTKLACEHLAHAYAESFGLDHVALRYFTVYGPRQRPDMAIAKIVHALLGGATFGVFGSGDQSRDVTYVGDAITATLAAMEVAPSGAVYNVGGGTETTVNRVIRICEQISGRKLARKSERPAVGDVRRTSADTSLARAELAWRPKTSLEEGLRAQLEWAGM
jgi:UDP-glucuronate 4-epimerase